MKQKFIVGKVYVDRNNTKYSYLGKFGTGTAITFLNLKANVKSVKTTEGKYMWDGSDHPEDIISEISE